jgi:hypothetical protein
MHHQTSFPIHSFTSCCKVFCSVDVSWMFYTLLFIMCCVSFLSTSSFIHTEKWFAFLLTCHCFTFQVTGQVNFSFMTFCTVVDLIFSHHELHLWNLQSLINWWHFIGDYCLWCSRLTLIQIKTLSISANPRYLIFQAAASVENRTQRSIP